RGHPGRVPRHLPAADRAHRLSPAPAPRGHRTGGARHGNDGTRGIGDGDPAWHLHALLLRGWLPRLCPYPWFLWPRRERSRRATDPTHLFRRPATGPAAGPARAQLPAET